MDFKALALPFAPTDIEWRIGRVGLKDGKVWATCLAYITSRAIMQRFDDVIGPESWRNEFKEWTTGSPGVLCGISVKIGAEWVTKWDGAEQTDIESVKGGLSNAMKRAAVHWGIGRYLYDLPEGYAVVVEKGRYYAGKTKTKKGEEIPAFKWNPPSLPAWALPKAE